jgi:hypothetical protein
VGDRPGDTVGVAGRSAAGQWHLPLLLRDPEDRSEDQQRMPRAACVRRRSQGPAGVLAGGLPKSASGRPPCRGVRCLVVGRLIEWSAAVAAKEVVTSQSDRRIDRPLLPELPPSERQVSGTRGRAGLGSHAGVRGRRGTPWTGGRPPTARRTAARTRCGPCATAADMATHAARGRIHARNHCYRRPRPGQAR